jgi:septal ring factor EnvC (AmiA/AmiB activator)
MNFKSLLYLFFLTILCFSSFGQSTKLKKAQKDVDDIRKLIKTLDIKTGKTFLEYKLLSKQITYQEILLQKMKKEIDSVSLVIEENTKVREELLREIERLKKEYEELIFYAYKTRSTRDKTIFILSSASFNQAYRRFVYLQYLTEFLEQTTGDLEIKTDSLVLINDYLKLQKIEKEQLKETQTNELIKLNESKVILNDIIFQLNSQREKLVAELKEKERIAEAIRISMKKNVNNENLGSKSALSLKFEANKGNFPMPVKGIITSYFGEHTHPVLKNVKVNNDGIEIATNIGEKAKSIHPGIVSQVLKIPGANQAVIIKHGEYYTVFSNLSEVYVKKGDNVTKGQNIGLPDSRILNFQIWYQNVKLDPQLWLN